MYKRAGPCCPDIFRRCTPCTTTPRDSTYTCHAHSYRSGFGLKQTVLFQRHNQCNLSVLPCPGIFRKCTPSTTIPPRSTSTCQRCRSCRGFGPWQTAPCQRGRSCSSLLLPRSDISPRCTPCSCCLPVQPRRNQKGNWYTCLHSGRSTFRSDSFHSLGS